MITLNHPLASLSLVLGITGMHHLVVLFQAGAGTQDFMHARQVLYEWWPSPKRWEMDGLRPVWTPAFPDPVLTFDLIFIPLKAYSELGLCLVLTFELLDLDLL